MEIPVTRDSEAGSYHHEEAFHAICALDPDETVRVQELIDQLRSLTFPPYRNAYLKIDDERYYDDLSITPEDDAESGDVHWNIPEYDN